MSFLAGKKILITGLLSNRSIAYGIAKACQAQGAELAFTYQSDRFEQRTKDLAAEFDSTMVFECDVADDGQIDRLFESLGQQWDQLNGLVHAIGFAPREAIAGSYLDGASREAFRIAHDISSYSLTAMASSGKELLVKGGGSIITLTYLGANQVVPNYNTMGLAKASLEASVRYLAADLGPEGVRVNGISAGPIKTLAASGIKGFSKILSHVAANSPLRRNITSLEVGNVASFLMSDLASGMTGEITYVDAGFHHVMGSID